MIELKKEYQARQQLGLFRFSAYSQKYGITPIEYTKYLKL